MKPKTTKRALWIALGGQTLQGLGIAWAIYLYNQQHSANYSLLCNFVSELGSPHQSMMAKVFNRTLIYTSPLVFPIVWSLGTHIRTKLSYTAIATGFCALLGAVGVGVLPMDFLKPHLIAAMMFFWGWLLTMFLFTAAFCRKYSFKASPALMISGIVAMVACGTFLRYLGKSVAAFQRAGLLNGTATGKALPTLESFHRPAIWDIAILEWGVVFSIALWVLVTFIYLLRVKETTREG